MKQSSTDDFKESVKRQCLRLKSILEKTDAVAVGAGAGLSAAAGFSYSGKRFRSRFFDFEEKYGFQDMYAGGFYPYPSPEEFWAYWSRYIFINRYDQPAGKAYEDLKNLLENKDYFVVTTNVDHRFQIAGFDKTRLFYTQGDFGLFQCSVPCHRKTYDNEETVRAMVKEQRELKIPSSLLPFCPVCGKPMTMNLRSDGKFVEDEGWQLAGRRYETFLKKHEGRPILFLELGVGGNTPEIVKYPFRQMTYRNQNAFYACLNLNDAYAPKKIENRALCISEDIGKVLSFLLHGDSQTAP